MLHYLLTCTVKYRQKGKLLRFIKKYPTVENHKKYAKARNQVKWGIRKLIITKEKDIAANVKKNPKAFYRYMSSKIKTTDPVANLKKQDGTLTENNTKKANVLVDFFTMFSQ